MRKIHLFICFLILGSVAFSQRLELPLSSSFDSHSGYFYEYSPEYKQSKWVAYQLIGTNILQNTLPEVQFYADPKLPDGALNGGDFYQRVYQPGQLKPSGDARVDKVEMHDAYYYANICPMQPTFDQEVWRILENLVRSWSLVFDTIYVVSGPAFKNVKKVMADSVGPHKIPVPDYFYKVLLVNNGIDMEAIGFVLPNIDVRYEYMKNPVSIDSVEKLTGIDFFYQLPDYLEQDVEQRINSSFWTGGSNSYYIKSKMKRKEVQCIANTVMDKRCTALTKCINGCCALHGCEGE
jgi:endonuclease G